MRPWSKLWAALLLAACSSSSAPPVLDAQPWRDAGADRGVDVALADAFPLDLAPPPPPPNCGGFTKLSGKITLTIKHGGRQREAFVNIPSSYDGTKPTPVVLDFHGLGSNAGQQLAYTGMEFAAAAAGMVSVHPQGVGVVAQSWNAAKSCCGEASLLGVDDVGFVAALLDQLAKQVCVDPRRIYAAGMSNGGFFSYRLACDLSDRIAAIAPVAGILLCSPQRPMPTFHFHGTKDVLVAYHGNSLLGWPGALDSVETMARHNGCSGTPQTYLQTGDATCIQWEASSCASGAEVRLCTIDGGGHTWPGGLDVPIPWLGHKSTDISATDSILAFFKAHALPAP